MRILYFGSYSLNNSRNAVLIKGLRKNGVEVFECNDHSRNYLMKCIRLFIRYLPYFGKFDAMIVGFSGQELMPLARILTRMPIVFDVFTSHYMGYILDRRYYSPSSLRAKYYRFIDGFSCRLANIVLLDTQAHIDYFVKEFRLPAKKFRKIWLGANTDIYKPGNANTNIRAPLKIIFWGNFIPLQGVDVIVKAAKIIEHTDVQFYLIGKGQSLDDCKELSHTLGIRNIQFPGYVSYPDLIQFIHRADICLGVFSRGVKADSTIQNKIFEALAMRKPLITSNTSAVRELLTDKVHCLLCNPADPQSLADKILLLNRDIELRKKIADNGYKLFTEILTEEKLGRDFRTILEEIT